jgi:hypothetical protein
MCLIPWVSSELNLPRYNTHTMLICQLSYVRQDALRKLVSNVFHTSHSVKLAHFC